MGITFQNNREYRNRYVRTEGRQASTIRQTYGGILEPIDFDNPRNG